MIERLFRLIKPGTRQQMVCFHHAGGSAEYFCRGKRICHRTPPCMPFNFLGMAGGLTNRYCTICIKWLMSLLRVMFTCLCVTRFLWPQHGGRFGF